MCKGSTDHSKIKQQATKNVQSNDIVTSFYQNKEFVQLEGEAEGISSIIHLVMFTCIYIFKLSFVISSDNEI